MFVFIRKQTVRNMKMKMEYGANRFNTYQKVDGQKPTKIELASPRWFYVYQKVDGQKPKIKNYQPHLWF